MPVLTRSQYCIYFCIFSVLFDMNEFNSLFSWPDQPNNHLVVLQVVVHDVVVALDEIRKVNLAILVMI